MIGAAQKSSISESLKSVVVARDWLLREHSTEVSRGLRQIEEGLQSLLRRATDKKRLRKRIRAEITATAKLRRETNEFSESLLARKHDI